MKRSSFICGLLLWCAAATAQELPQPTEADDLWRQATRDNSLDLRVFGRAARDGDAFRALAARFAAADSTLTLSQIMTLYYGSAYRDAYDGGYSCAASREIKESDPARAYELCKAALEVNPASPALLGEAIATGTAAGREAAEIDRLRWRRTLLLKAIYALGDGSREHPYIVMSVADEYALMYFLLNVDRVSNQALVRLNDGTPCDRITIRGGNPEMVSGNELWFDVSYPMTVLTRPNHWAERLDGEK